MLQSDVEAAILIQEMCGLVDAGASPQAAADTIVAKMKSRQPMRRAAQRLLRKYEDEKEQWQAQQRRKHVSKVKLAAFQERQRKLGRLVSLGDIAKWIAQYNVAPGVVVDEAKFALAYENLHKSIRRGEFARLCHVTVGNNGVWLLGRHGQPEMLSEFEAQWMKDSLGLPKWNEAYIAPCWTTRTLARRWFNRHYSRLGYPMPFSLEDHEAGWLPKEPAAMLPTQASTSTNQSVRSDQGQKA